MPLGADKKAVHTAINNLFKIYNIAETKLPRTLDQYNEFLDSSDVTISTFAKLQLEDSAKITALNELVSTLIEASTTSYNPHIYSLLLHCQDFIGLSYYDQGKYELAVSTFENAMINVRSQIKLSQKRINSTQATELATLQQKIAICFLTERKLLIASDFFVRAINFHKLALEMSNQQHNIESIVVTYDLAEFCITKLGQTKQRLALHHEKLNLLLEKDVPIETIQEQYQALDKLIDDNQIAFELAGATQLSTLKFVYKTTLELILMTGTPDSSLIDKVNIIASNASEDSFIYTATKHLQHTIELMCQKDSVCNSTKEIIRPYAEQIQQKEAPISKHELKRRIETLEEENKLLKGKRRKATPMPMKQQSLDAFFKPISEKTSSSMSSTPQRVPSAGLNSNDG